MYKMNVVFREKMGKYTVAAQDLQKELKKIIFES